ncbi:AraC family transcriptional regulator [filamentous cyanobacterium CCT1]|nr:AraC family transcriptional regulator [filamentous cyanobacterium CCT1]PSN76756.1 AraC family transcriptional regulator [filamentous cyanobacterium CCP4]
MRLFSSADYDALYQERIERGEVICCEHDFEVVETSYGGLSQGRFYRVDLRPELWLEIFDEYWQEPLSLKTRHHNKMPLIAKFYLKGRHRVSTANVAEVPPEYEEVEGQNYLFFLPDLTEIEENPAGSLKVVRICLDIDEFRRLNTGFQALPLPLRQVVEGQDEIRFHQGLGRLTPAMRVAIAQILNCPYQGATKRFFLEAKALELLALQLDQWSQEPQPRAVKKLPSGDLERLYQARNVIQQNLTDPPSLLELARQVGLNDYKLKQGFRQHFGTTVFGYLQTCRMEQAQHLLLENPHLTVAGVAQSVGYASHSRFCHAFKRQFGASPQAYRIAQRG